MMELLLKRELKMVFAQHIHIISSLRRQALAFLSLDRQILKKCPQNLILPFGLCQLILILSPSLLISLVEPKYGLKVRAQEFSTSLLLDQEIQTM